MKEKGIISTNQFVWMLFSIIAAFAILDIPGLLIFHAGRDAWLSLAGAWFLDVLLAMVYAYMGLRFPGQNTVQYSISILGKYAGRIVGIMFPLFYLLVASALMRSLTELISSFFLLRTPVALTLAMSFIVIAYGIKKGIEAIARTCEVLGPIYLLSLIILFALLIPKLEIHRLKPILAQGAYPILTGIPFILSFIGTCIIMGMYIPICNKPENGFLAKFIAVTLGVSMIGLVIVFGVGIFGAERAGNMVNPGIRLARWASIGDFLQRLEIIYFALSVAAGVMTSANMMWAFSLGISQVAGLNSYKPIVYPAVLLAFVLSMTAIGNAVELYDFAIYSYMFIAIFVETGLEMLLFITALILGKRGNSA